jgi:integrase
MPGNQPSIYHRPKDSTGKWLSVRKVQEGRGKSTGDIKPPFNTTMTVISSLLKKNKVEPRIDLPTVPKKTAVKFPQEVLKKLFEAMDEEEKFRYGFFLETACREQEVMYATWNDIDLSAKEYIVQAKPDVKFEPKDHETRRIPLS